MRFLTKRPAVLPPDPSVSRRLFAERHDTPISRVICLLLGGAGLLVLANSTAEFLRIAAMQRWPVVQATVLAVSVERSGRQQAWEPRVRYSFEVGGRRYTNTRLALNPVTFTTYSDAEAYVPRVGLLAGAGTLLPILSLSLAVRLWRKPVPLWTRPSPSFEG
jgi:hypothetical protein